MNSCHHRCVRLLFLLLWFFGSSVVHGQDPGEVAWELRVPGDGIALGRCVVEAHDDGVIVGGWTASVDLKVVHGYLVKINDAGEILWERRLGDKGGDAWSVARTKDRAYIVAGSTSFVTGDLISDFYLTKRDAEGELLWQQTYGGGDQDYGTSTQETRDGGVVMAGWTSMFNGGHSEAYVIKTDQDGRVLWEKRYAGVERQGAQASSIAEAADGTFLVAGITTIDAPVLPTRYLMKIDGQGNPIWETTIDDGMGRLKWVGALTSGGCVVGGSSVTFQGQNVFVAEIDAMGKVLSKTAFDDSIEVSDSFTQLANGGFLVAGGYNQDNHGRTCALQIVGTDYYGQKLWDRLFVPLRVDNCNAIAIQKMDGSYVMVGGVDNRLYAVKLYHEPANPLLFVRGDTDGDGKRDITDAINVLNRLFGAGLKASCADAEDSNDDGKVDLSDAIYVLDYLFRGSALLPIPSAFCGLDPTEDEIHCLGQPACMAEGT